ncbi:MAG: tetratricopeptide repeat protein [Actinomycetota bacterium]
MLRKYKLIEFLSVAVALSGLTASHAVGATPSATVSSGSTLAEQFAQNSGANDYFQQGLTSYQQGDLPKAEVAFRKAVEIDPTFAEAYANLGSVLANQNKLAEAIPAFLQAIRLQPNSPAFHYLLGVALYQNNRLPEAIGPLRKARDLLKSQGKNQDAESINQLLKSVGLKE